MQLGHQIVRRFAHDHPQRTVINQQIEEMRLRVTGRRARVWTRRMGNDVQGSLAVDLARLIELAETTRG